MCFLNQRAEENLVVNNKDIECLCLGTIGLIVAPWKFDVLKTSTFALQASLLEQIFVLRTSDFNGATISRQFLDRNTLLFNQSTVAVRVVHEMRSFGRKFRCKRVDEFLRRLKEAHLRFLDCKNLIIFKKRMRA